MQRHVVSNYHGSTINVGLKDEASSENEMGNSIRPSGYLIAKKTVALMEL